jgi:glycosyltransferase involved in cell wall biosynthesis
MTEAERAAATDETRSNSAKLRVAHVIVGLEAGGAEALLFRISTQESDVDHQVISLTDRGWYGAALEAHGIPVCYLRLGPLSSVLSGIFHLNHLIRSNPPDVVHTWMYRANIVGGIAARLSGVPVVWAIHHSTLGTLKWPSRLLAYLGGFAARFVPNFVINCSARSAAIHARIGYNAAPGMVIHNGYDPAAFYPDPSRRHTTRKSLELPDDSFVIGSIARWHPQKDIPNLLRAAAICRDRGIPIVCLLVGDKLDAENAELLDAVHAAGAADIVRLLGRRSDVADLACALDLHVLASADGEAFPNVVAETMLCGTPNVVTDVGDAAIMVGESGWIVPPCSSDKLANAIEDAYRESHERPSGWQRRSFEARALIADRFAFRKMASAYEAVWRTVAERT